MEIVFNLLAVTRVRNQSILTERRCKRQEERRTQGLELLREYVKMYISNSCNGCFIIMCCIVGQRECGLSWQTHTELSPFFTELYSESHLIV